MDFLGLAYFNGDPECSKTGRTQTMASIWRWRRLITMTNRYWNRLEPAVQDEGVFQLRERRYEELHEGIKAGES